LDISHRRPLDAGLEAADAARADLEIQRRRVRAPPRRAIANDRAPSLLVLRA
jgi:hypothetical protein